MKKAIPYLVILVLFFVALAVRNSREGKSASSETTSADSLSVFSDPKAEYFFTKHARCRMECRDISQKEVKEIVRQASINYEKSDLHAPRGAKYALEGYTRDENQHVRIIVAPKKRHLSIVTVIDLEKDWECPSCR